MSIAPYCTVTLRYQNEVGGAVAVPSDILDARDSPLPGTLEDCGFGLIEHRSAVADWSDPHAIDTASRHEMAELARSMSGCDAVAVYGSIIRSPASEAAVPDYGPIDFVHSDFTDDYRAMVTEPGRPYLGFVEPLLERQGLTLADVRSARRIAILQFWRNTGPADADYPLAVCDARDVGRARLRPFVVAEYGGARLEFETFGVRPPPRGHTDHWYTFTRPAIDEVLAFRTYDSERADAGLPFWTPHTAFRDPHVTDGADHRRHSAEIRTLCLWN